jgi:hypothetical protein
MPNKNGLTVGDVLAFAERVKAALESAEADRRTVAALRALVGGNGAGLSRAAFARRGGAGLRGRAQSTSVADGRILELVRGRKDGVVAGDLIKALRLNRKALNRALRRLRSEGKVKMTGKKRLARYFAN